MSAFARFLVALPAGALYGWAASLLWAWFLVPLGLPAVSMWHAWGLLLLVSLVRVWGMQMPDTSAETDEAKSWAFFILKLIAVLLCVGIGALIKGGVA